MKIFLKVFLSGILGSFIFGIIGGIAGAYLSGTIDFPNIGHAAGYESGGVIVGTISMVLGGTLGSWLALSRRDKKNMFLASTGIVMIISLIAVCGSLIAEASLDDFPQYFSDGIQLVVLVAMPLIIARRAMRSLVAS